MAGLPWIKVWTAIATHPKVQRLEKDLGIPDALGLVIRLWCWTADYHPDGEIPASDSPAMTRFVICDLGLGSDADVTLACVTCGLLDPIPGGFRVHDWHEMQTSHVEAVERRRLQARERQARFRAKRSVTVTRDITRNVTRDSVTEIRGDKTREEEIKKHRAPSPDGSGSPPKRTRRKKGTDPRHAPLVARLVEVFEQVRGSKYGFAPRDAVAVSRLITLGSDAEVEARWRSALDIGARWPGTSSIAALPGRWNDLANGQPTRGMAPVGSDWTKTLADVVREEEEAKRRKGEV
jgi:hypothetical protein